MSNPLPLTINVDDRGADATTVVAVSGELDFGTTAQLVDVVEPLAESGESLILDLGDVTFCDSSALGALVRLHKIASAAGGSICLAQLRPQVAVIINVTSLNRLFVICDEIPRVIDGDCH